MMTAILVKIVHKLREVMTVMYVIEKESYYIHKEQTFFTLADNVWLLPGQLRVICYTSD